MQRIFWHCNLKNHYSIYKVKYKCYLSVKTLLELFQKIISPILVYGAEVWGYEYCKQIENVQTKFCKRIIGLSSSSSNVTALGECGTLSLCCIYYVKCIKYWLKILNE